MRGNKHYSKALIDCWFVHTFCSHKHTLYKPESVCPTQDSMEINNISHRSTQVIKPERYEYAANRRIHSPKCSLIWGQHAIEICILV